MLCVVGVDSSPGCHWEVLWSCWSHLSSAATSDKPQRSANSSGDYLKKPVAAKGAVSCYKICCTQKHLEHFLISLHRKCFHQRTDSHKHALYKHITSHICQYKVFRLYTLSISGNPVFLKYANSANYCGGIGRKRTTV